MIPLGALASGVQVGESASRQKEGFGGRIELRVIRQFSSVVRQSRERILRQNIATCFHATPLETVVPGVGADDVDRVLCGVQRGAEPSDLP